MSWKPHAEVMVNIIYQIHDGYSHSKKYCLVSLGIPKYSLEFQSLKKKLNGTISRIILLTHFLKTFIHKLIMRFSIVFKIVLLGVHFVQFLLAYATSRPAHGPTLPLPNSVSIATYDRVKYLCACLVTSWSVRQPSNMVFYGYFKRDSPCFRKKIRHQNKI